VFSCQLPSSQLSLYGVVLHTSDTTELLCNTTGVYIPDSRTNVPKDLRGLGMRIEDDVLVTTSGPYNLCSQCPKQPNEIESLMSS